MQCDRETGGGNDQQKSGVNLNLNAPAVTEGMVKRIVKPLAV